MGQEFIDLARRGLNEPWRYLISFLVIVFGWLFLGSLFSGLVLVAGLAIFHPSVLNQAGSVPLDQLDPLVTFVGANAQFVLLLVSVLLAVAIIHRRPVRSLITTRPSFEWGRAWLGFWLWLVLAGLGSLVEALLYPGRYQVTLNVVELLKFLPFALVLTPVQTTAEELFVRGYLLQGVGLLVRVPIISAVLTSLFFMSLHAANPEMGLSPLLMALGYFGFGLLASVCTLRDNRMELALGVHASNNLFSWVIVNYTASPLASPSLFTSKLEPVYSTVSFVAMAVAFYLVVFYGLDRLAGAKARKEARSA